MVEIRLADGSTNLDSEIEILHMTMSAFDPIVGGDESLSNDILSDLRLNDFDFKSNIFN